MKSGQASTQSLTVSRSRAPLGDEFQSEPPRLATPAATMAHHLRKPEGTGGSFGQGRQAPGLGGEEARQGSRVPLGEEDLTHVGLDPGRRVDASAPHRAGSLDPLRPPGGLLQGALDA